MNEAQGRPQRLYTKFIMDHKADRNAYGNLYLGICSNRLQFEPKSFGKEYSHTYITKMSLLSGKGGYQSGPPWWWWGAKATTRTALGCCIN